MITGLSSFNTRWIATKQYAAQSIVKDMGKAIVALAQLLQT